MINSYLTRKRVKGLAPEMVCKDGFKMSVQASETHYCSPRSDNDIYTEVEVGFPSEKEDLLMEYAESQDNPTGTVYGWVPVEVVAQVVVKHGGLVDDSIQPEEPEDSLDRAMSKPLIPHQRRSDV